MVVLCDALSRELCRYIEQYQWSFRLVSHIFRLKHDMELSVRDVECLYENIKNGGKVGGF